MTYIELETGEKVFIILSLLIISLALIILFYCKDPKVAKSFVKDSFLCLIAGFILYYYFKYVINLLIFLAIIWVIDKICGCVDDQNRRNRGNPPNFSLLKYLNQFQGPMQDMHVNYYE